MRRVIAPQFALAQQRRINVAQRMAPQRTGAVRNLPNLTSAAIKTGSLSFFAAIPFIYMNIYGIVYDFAEVGLLLAVLAAIATHLVFRRIYISAFVPLLILAAIYVYFSYYHALPSAWTKYYRRDFISRHAMWVPLFALFSSYFCIFFLRFDQIIKKHSGKLAIGSFIIGRISLYIFPPLNHSLFYSLTVYGFVPENTVFLIFFLMWFFNTSRNHAESLFATCAVLLICTSTQTLALMLCTIVLKYSKLRKSIIFGLCAVLGLAMAIAPYYAAELYRVDSSSGFRAVIWGDARDAFFESNLIGVGFGTEYIRNDFSPGDNADYKVVGEDTSRRLLIGTHNSIFDIALRMGAPGLLAFFYAWRKILDRGKIVIRENDEIYYCILVLIILNNTLNMGVAAPNFMLTTALGAGWLLASNTSGNYFNALRSQRARRIAHGLRRPSGSRQPGR